VWSSICRDGEEGVDGFYSISAEEAQDMIKMADVDQNGTVDFEEFWTFTTAKMRGEHDEVISPQRIPCSTWATRTQADAFLVFCCRTLRGTGRSRLRRAT